MRRQAIALIAAAFILAPPGARAADLVVWWEEGFNPEEDTAVREIVAAFERETGKQVELQLPSHNDMLAKILAAVESGHPPDFLYGQQTDWYYGQWADEGRLVDLSDVIGPFGDMFDPAGLGYATLFDSTTGQRGLYALPMAFSTDNVHVWRRLLEQAGFTLAEVPKQWDAFWSFWCDQVQPAIRKALGRDDIYGVALSISPKAPGDTRLQFEQFMQAYGANYVTREGKLVIDDPEIRRRLIKTVDSYAAIYRKGCTPPDAVDWDDAGNNQAFLARAVVMTVNGTLSVPNAIKAQRPEDYYQDAASIEWPEAADGQPLANKIDYFAAVAFKAGGHIAPAKEFVHFLVGKGWLAHYLDFSGERMLPSLSKLLDQPFWLDPKDPHRMVAAMQFLSRPRTYNYGVVSGNWRHVVVEREAVWSHAVHRVAADGITPEQAVDEAIARIKQILAE
jgi:multiple sugar transport system substrate-binding protein